MAGAGVVVGPPNRGQFWGVSGAKYNGGLFPSYFCWLPTRAPYGGQPGVFLGKFGHDCGVGIAFFGTHFPTFPPHPRRRRGSAPPSQSVAYGASERSELASQFFEDFALRVVRFGQPGAGLEGYDYRLGEEYRLGHVYPLIRTEADRFRLGPVAGQDRRVDLCEVVFQGRTEVLGSVGLYRCFG